jgi:trehalose/maltose transport system substrate-binding protein
VFIVQHAWALNANFKPNHRIVLTAFGFGYEAVRQLPSEGLEEFTRNTGIQLDFVPAWGDSKAQLQIAERTLESHMSTPDIYLIDTIWIGRLARHLLDLGPYLDADAHAQFPQLVKNDTVDGRVIALPWYLNVGMLYYRADLLKKYGYKRPPSSWQELETMASRIQQGERAHGTTDFWGYLFQGASYEGLTCNALEWQVSFGGGQIIESDGTVTVNNPKAAKAFGTVATWIGRISPPSVLSYTELDSLNAFRSGKAAFLRYWSSGYKVLSNQPAIRGNFDVTVLPSGPDRHAQAMGGFQLAVSAYSTHPREAAQAILYLAGSYIQKRRALQEGYLPTLPKLLDDPEVRSAVPETRALISAGVDPWISRPSTVADALYSDVSRIYYEGVHSILSRERRSDEVLRDIQEQMIALSPRFHLHK